MLRLLQALLLEARNRTALQSIAREVRTQSTNVGTAQSKAGGGGNQDANALPISR